MGQRIHFIPKDQVVISDLKIKELYEEEAPVRFETKRLTKKGQLLDVLIHAAIIKDAVGTSKGVVVNISDITEKNQMENQLRQSHKNESISTLASGISSKFNNLLYVIYGNAELLLSAISAENKEYLDEIFNSTKKGMELIRQLQIFTDHTDHTDRKSNAQTINLNMEVKRTFDSIGRLIPKKTEVKLDFADNLYALAGDLEQIKQVLLNLCFNAGDAMPDGGKLTIKTENCIIDDFFQGRHPELKKGWFVKLSVSDTGHGMNNEVRKRIFDPFYTTKDSRKRSGLGLSVIYGIIKSHGGLIQCGSIPGVGTTFTIYLPSKVESTSSASAFPPILSAENHTVLIVDDEQSVLTLSKKMVTSLGYNVITVNSGEKALVEYYARQSQIDLVLLDLAMPGMGWQICLKKLI